MHSSIYSRNHPPIVCATLSLGTSCASQNLRGNVCNLATASNKCTRSRLSETHAFDKRLSKIDPPVQPFPYLALDLYFSAASCSCKHRKNPGLDEQVAILPRNGHPSKSRHGQALAQINRELRRERDDAIYLDQAHTVTQVSRYS